MWFQLSLNNQWACPAPAPLEAVCVGCAMGVLILSLLLFLNLVVLKLFLLALWVFSGSASSTERNAHVDMSWGNCPGHPCHGDGMVREMTRSGTGLGLRNIEVNAACISPSRIANDVGRSSKPDEVRHLFLICYCHLGLRVRVTAVPAHHLGQALAPLFLYRFP